MTITVGLFDITYQRLEKRIKGIDPKIEYLKLCESLDSINHSFDFSIKLSQLGLNIDREFCTDNLKQLARAMGNHTIRLDM